MKKKLEYFIPLGLLILGIICIIVRIIVKSANSLTFQFCFSCLITSLLVIYPLIGKLLKIELPLSIEIIIAIHLILAVILGTGYRVYDYISWWDVFVHGYFGCASVFIAYWILIHVKGHDILLPGKIIFFYVFGMGLGAMWEIFEYLGDSITGGDAQHVYDAAEGVSPVADTMEDLMITFAGITIITVIYLISYFNKKKIINLIDKDFGYKKEDSLN